MTSTPPFTAITSVRSTLLMTTRSALAQHGILSSYEALLAVEARAALSSLVAGTWIPVDLVSSHYDALDALELDQAKLLEIGRASGERLSGTLLGTIAKLVPTTGATPLTLLESFSRFWGRVFQGGGALHRAQGPKEVKMFVHAAPIARSRYFRFALAGTAEAIFKQFSMRTFVRVLPMTNASHATYLLQWV